MRASTVQLFGFSLLCLLFCLAGCESKERARRVHIPEVVVGRIEAQDVPLYVELSGRVSALQKAEVRPQVGGILQKQLFTEGSIVTQGQSLYKIDPATYEAEHLSSKAALARAEASLTQAKLRRDRRHGLLGSHAVSKQAVEDADAEYLQAKADVEVCQAQVRTTEIRLRYTDVLAPITGRIGKSQVTQGALVTANQAQPLAVIHQLDPIYVDMTRSSLDLLQLQLRTKSQQNVCQTRVRLFLDQRQRYAHEGVMQFADVAVDESTGMVLLRAVFPNPDGILLPGLYVRAIVDEGVEHGALLLPETAIVRSARGGTSVFVVKEKNVVEERHVRTGKRSAQNIIVTEGLQAGEMVVVAGQRGLKNGDAVQIRQERSLRMPVE